MRNVLESGMLFRKGSIKQITIQLEPGETSACIVRDAIAMSKRLGNIPIRIISDDFNGIVYGTMRWQNVVYGGSGSNRATAEYYEAHYPEEFGFCPHLTDE